MVKHHERAISFHTRLKYSLRCYKDYVRGKWSLDLVFCGNQFFGPSVLASTDDCNAQFAKSRDGTIMLFLDCLNSIFT